jgi:hypothetical protein
MLARDYFIAYADADANTKISTGYISGSSYNFDNYTYNVINTAGIPSYISACYDYFGGISVAYSDSGLGGRAVLKNLFGAYIGGGPVSSGEAKYISLASSNTNYVVAYADAGAGDVLRVKSTGGLSVWTDLGYPAVAVESIAVGFFSQTETFAVYTTSAADGRQLKFTLR